jgi:(1->4)-alpha-D-glucan 1-alpha-D-glucosylmutase
MTESNALERLCRLVGIAAEYTDIWGMVHRVPDATRLSLLHAMGVIRDAADVPAALKEREERPWRRGLAPATVVRQAVPPYVIVYRCAESLAARSHRWTLTLENGETKTGEFQPEQLEQRGHRDVDGVSFVEVAFQWRDRLPLGYHRFAVHPPGAQTGATTSLIVAPDRCYLPPALEGEGRVWGPALQLYALRSGRNWGIGDFTDLRNAVEIAGRAGAGIVGVNPLHALFPHNPQHKSPYSPSSRQFLNVFYLDVEAVPEFAECVEARELVADPQFQARLRALRAAELVDYAGVAEVKLPVLELLFAHFRKRHLAAGTARAKAFQQYRQAQGEALERFAVYHALQEHLHAQNPSVWGWPVWPEDYRDPLAPAVKRFTQTHRDRIDYHAWLQWLCEEQLAACGKRSWEMGLGVGLYQDLAVSIDRAGAEAWAWQRLYALEASIGAPPDDFNLHGQDWGLPPLIPERLEEAAYAPFIAMLRANMRHAGALRIDHVMGLLRLFWVPAGRKPAEGCYVHYSFQHLLGILALESQRNHCLVVGEDLGTVPDEVRAGLGSLGVLSYRLLLFEKESDGAFKPPQAYPAQALVAVSTHDLPTLKSFWLGHDLDLRANLRLYPSEEVRAKQLVERSQDRARLLWALEREELLPAGVSHHPISAPEMTPELMLAIHAYLARSPAKIMMVQMEDVLGQLEQVNLPGTTDQYPNWQRKLPLNLEEWGADPRFTVLAETLKRSRGAGVHPKEEAAAPGRPDATPIIPRATYRLQLNRAFTFTRAAELVPYLAQLGVSHVYCSPYLKARPGSLHGYDIIDHTALNPEIGSEEDFERFVSTLKAYGMGQILDMVPNHMGVLGADNAYWLDVLENGPASVHAGVFDIDWEPVKDEIQGKVLVPVLGDQYGTILERGELKLAFDLQRGEFSVWYYEHRFPVDPREYPRILLYAIERLDARLGVDHPDALEFKSLATAFQHLPARSETDPTKLAERHRDKEIHKRHLGELVRRSSDLAWYIDEVVKELNGTPGDALSFDALHLLLEAQAYRLAYWRVASDEINYRRFFDINDLAALRMENPEAFEFTHRRVLELLNAGKVEGLRIDHPDGLFDPVEYFRRLQYRRAHVPPLSAEPEGQPPFRSTYVVVEKILESNERLPEDWPVHGTTGYDFMNLVGGLFLDPAAGPRLERFYRAFTRKADSFDEILYQAKRLIMRTALAGELNVLATQLNRISEADRHTCDFTLNNLRYALREIVACFPVYRTYIAHGAAREDDRRTIHQAVEAAKRRSRASDVSVFDFVREVMLTTIADGKSDVYRRQVLSFAMKLQQYTAPVTAKGMEDTSFYLYNRLISLNEVGGDPRRFGVTPLAFHRANRERRKSCPHTLLATSTHDNKRSEDVRARLHVLSEIPDEWRAKVLRWNRINRSHKRKLETLRAPSLNDEYFLYQTLLGAWPLEPLDQAGLAAFRERIERAMLKAIREAKAYTSWINPDPVYEEAMLGFIGALLTPETDNPFLAEFLPFQRKVARLGLLNSLSQVLLKLTVPGVPDLYQGNELWDFSLVDPDNRRPVDYEHRARLLAQLRQAASGDPSALADYVAELYEDIEDGRLKLYFTWKLLALRAEREAPFRCGEYLPLRVTGPRSDHVVAFARSHGDTTVAVATTRWFARLNAVMVKPVGNVWTDTAVETPGPGEWVNVLTGERVAAADGSGMVSVPATELFRTIPWAVLVPG